MTQRTLRVPLLILAFGLLSALCPGGPEAMTVFTRDGTALTAGNLTPPFNRFPVLFVHGHDPAPDPQHPNYRKNFHDPIDTLPAFKLALDLAENDCLGLEPYYIHFGDDEASQQRSIDEDAAEIATAVTLILDRHRLRDPNNPTLKLAIIAYSKGTISTRKYLKQLVAAGSPVPVSEFIAIAPPNHGLNWPGLSGPSGYPSGRQLNNGYNPLCGSYGDSTQNYIADLNGHPIQDSQSATGFYPDEAPGSRPNGSAIDQGVLYVTLYAADNGDFVGGSDPSGDCQGRVLAKNLAPDAVNLDDIVIPSTPAAVAIPGWLESFLTPETEARLARHQNTVHHPEVIFRALYTAAHHQAPPPGTSYGTVGGIPVIPPPVSAPGSAAVVLLFDTSGSMAWSHEGAPGVDPSRQRLALAKQAAIPFLDMLRFFNPCRAGFGLARFPQQPFQGCTAEVLTPLAPAAAAAVQTAIETTIPALSAAGSTPLVAGLATAAGMFAGEARKALVLLSDGFHNCPAGSGPEDIGQAIDGLAAQAIRTYAIGFGQPGEVPQDILQQLAAQTQGGYYDVTTAAGFDPAAWDAATALQAAYKSILVDALQLDAAADPAGLIHPGRRQEHQFRVSDGDRKLAIFVGWAHAGKRRPTLLIRGSDGGEIPYRQTPPGVSFLDGNTFTLVKIGAGFLGQAGRVSAAPWSLEVALDGPEAGQPPLPFHWSVVTDSALALHPTVEMTSARTGRPVTLTARLTQDGRPLAGNANVWVRVARPLAGVGNWLAAAGVSAEELGRVPEQRGEERLSPLLRKVIYLSEHRRQRFSGPTAIDTLPLYDDGTHGDETAGDGVYTARFTATSVPGPYGFEFNAAGRSAAGMAFERNRRIEVHVPVKADSLAAEVVRLPGEGKDFDWFEIRLRPQDAFGNLLGPGRPELILWESRIGSFPDPVADSLEGTYSRRLALPAGTDPARVDVSFVVGDSPFSLNLGLALQKTPPVAAGWLAMLLVVLLVIMAMMIRAGRRP